MSFVRLSAVSLHTLSDMVIRTFPQGEFKTSGYIELGDSPHPVRRLTDHPALRARAWRLDIFLCIVGTQSYILRDCQTEVTVIRRFVHA